MPAEAPKLAVNTEIELFWPPTKQWQRGVIVKDWANGEYAIRFQDDGFEEPLTYRLTAYKYRVVSQQPAPAATITDGEYEVECIVDKVDQPQLMYRVKWKGYDLADCTWEPESNLVKAKNLVAAFESLLRRNSEEEVKSARATPEDRAMLAFLWDRLNQQDSTDTIDWTPDGTAFFVKSGNDLTNLLAAASPSFATFDDIVRRLTTLGFEQQTEGETKLFHHPCFHKESRLLVDYIGVHSVPLPTAQAKVQQIKENEAKMLRQQPAQNGYGDDVQMADASGAGFGAGASGSGFANQPQSGPQQSFLFNTMFPAESELDLNSCQQWRESDVSEWARHAFHGWGGEYGPMFTQLGVDGRVLLECDLGVIIEELALQDEQARMFQQAVKQLRDIRDTSIRNLTQEQQAMF